jgi:hypothetical protein
MWDPGWTGLECYYPVRSACQLGHLHVLDVGNCRGVMHTSLSLGPNPLSFPYYTVLKAETRGTDHELFLLLKPWTFI